MGKILIQALAAAAATILCLVHAPAVDAETAAPKRYSNRYFQFVYPQNASLTASSDGESVELRITRESAIWFAIDSPSADDYPDCGGGVAFLPCYVAERAKIHCDADSSEGTEYCLDADVKKASVSIGGKRGFQFHLTRTRENYASGVKTKYQDTQLLYYFEISPGRPKHRGWQTPLDRSGPHLLILEINGTNDDAIRKILGTLKFH